MSSSAVPSADAPIVEVRELCKTYRGSLLGRRRIDALRGVSLTARSGEVFGLLGPNGAGKTTLIKTLLGVVKPSSGAAALFGQSAGSSAARSRVGYLPESLRVDRHHTARSALRYYGRLSRMSSQQIVRRSDELLQLVGLQGRDRESVKRFSKGMYQRLGLAQALMHDPDLLVLDEPTDGLDPVGRNEVRKVIERLRDAGKTIFLNSHILQEVEMVCTRVAILAGGEIRGSGSIDELSHGVLSPRVTFDVAVPESGATGHAKPDLSWFESFFAVEEPELSVTEVTTTGCTHRLVASLPEQAAIDDAVDRMRRSGVSIVRLQAQRPTLEDTFMRLVETPTEST